MVRYSEYNPWIALAIGILVLLSGLLKLITGVGGEWHGVHIPTWTGWLFLPLGTIISILSIRSIRTWKEPEPPKYTNEEVCQVKEKLDRMYLREHGALPGAPESQTTGTPPPASITPAPPTPEQKARIARANAKIRQGFLLMLAGAAVFYAAGGVFLLIPASALFLVGLTRLAVGVVERS